MTEQPIGDIARGIVSGMRGETVWQEGKPITENGVYCGLPLDTYHTSCCDGPSVSKSALKHLIPAHGGSPKAFWGRWVFNPNRVEPKPSEALDFGKAAHALLLGDQVFTEHFIERPDYRPEDGEKPEKDRRKWNANANDCKEWLAYAAERKLTVITTDQMTMIRRMAIDANDHPAVQAGILNGRAERSLIAKHPETGIWLKARPDIIPNGSGDFVDFKTTASMDMEFLSRQVFDAGYYLQAGMLHLVCDILGVPFTSFGLLYCLKDEVPDTSFVEMAEEDIERGRFVVRQCLRTIRRCLDENEWPGAIPVNGDATLLRMKPWSAQQLDGWLDRETTGQLEAAE